MSTPRRPCPRSSAAPMIATGAFPFAPPTSASLVGVAEHAARLARQGEVAQSVEHTAENRGVAGSIPALATSARVSEALLEGREPTYDPHAQSTGRRTS